MWVPQTNTDLHYFLDLRKPGRVKGKGGGVRKKNFRRGLSNDCYETREREVPVLGTRDILGLLLDIGTLSLRQGPLVGYTDDKTLLVLAGPLSGPRLWVQTGFSVLSVPIWDGKGTSLAISSPPRPVNVRTYRLSPSLFYERVFGEAWK